MGTKARGKMSPLQLQMLLHYHTVGAPYAAGEPEHASSPAVAEQRQELTDAGLLQAVSGPSGFMTTELAGSYLRMALAAGSVTLSLGLSMRGRLQ